MSLSMLMSVLGYENRVAYGGLQALTEADQFLPDVVLLDLGMPGVDGYETCRSIRQREWGRRAAVIAVTGYGTPEDRAKSAAAGFDLHLLKPVSSVVMAETLLRVAAGLAQPRE
jgi:CheY-like chemotaxis protein